MPIFLGVISTVGDVYKDRIIPSTRNFYFVVKVESDDFYFKNEFYGENKDRKRLVRILISDGFGP